MALQSRRISPTLLCRRRVKQGTYDLERTSLVRHTAVAIKKPSSPDGILKSVTIQIERKTFTISLRENPRGRFLRITEDVNGRYDIIIIPSTGLEDFTRVFREMLETEATLARKANP